MAGSREELLANAFLAADVPDAVSDAGLDELTRYVAQVCNVPYALLGIHARGKTWFKCRVGVDATEAPLAEAQPGIEVVEDLANAGRTRHPLLAAVPDARFLAAAPLQDGAAGFGTLAVLDRRPRALAGHQLEALRVAAAEASAMLRLRRRVRLLEALLESSPDEFHVFDARGRYLYASERAARAMGFSSAQMLGRTWQELGWDPQYTPQFSGMLRLALDTGQLIEDARAVPGPSGVVHTEYVLAPLRGPRGEIEGVAVTARDVSARVAAEVERRIAEMELQTRDDRLARVHSLTAALAAAVTPADVARATLEVGVPAAGASGGMLYEVSGDSLTLVGQAGHPAAMEERLRRIPMSRAVAPVEVVRTRAPLFLRSRAEAAALLPQSEPELSMSANGAWAGFPLLVEGEVSGVLFFSFAREREFTEADRAELLTFARQCSQALRRARLLETAQKAVRQRDDVLAVVSHDLRNVLGIFRITAALLDRELPEDAGHARDRIKTLQGQAEAMGRLVDDLVEVARIDAGSLRIVPAGCEARALAQDAIASVQPIAQQKGIGLALECPEDPMPVHCDRGRILQVFANVLGNAVKFTDRGEVRLSVVATDGEVRFAIRDSGGGISPDHLPHLFERYWQARQGERSGAGLGLYIARGIVEAHGGRIWADSTPGQGTTICFTLPRA